MVKICSSCQEPLTKRVKDDFSVIRVKKCQHYMHYECFFDENKTHVKVDGTAKKMLCPECGEEIVHGSQDNTAKELVGERVRKIDLSFTDAKDTIKWVVGLSVASVVMIIALAVHQSIGSLLIGSAIGGFLGYKSARFVGRYFTFPAEIR